jgi:hypothetical protein
MITGISENSVILPKCARLANWRHFHFLFIGNWCLDSKLTNSNTKNFLIELQLKFGANFEARLSVLIG